jgi:dihydrofolate reductase
MSKVIIDMTLSVVGFIAGSNERASQPFDDRTAIRLHEWLLGGSHPYRAGSFLRPQGRNRDFVDAMFRTAGALLTGRRTCDLVNGCGGSHPVPGLSVVVLTHAPPTDVPKGNSSFTFCADLRSAVDAARKEAKEKDVMVHGRQTADLIAEGDYVVGRWEGGGTHTGPAFRDFLAGSLPANTGRTMRFTGMTVLKLKDGKILEEVGLDDGVTALQQLGLIRIAA